jgi:thioredoxin-related protein
MKKLLLLLTVLPLLTIGQTGIKFEHGLTWKEIQAKAKAENKFIFLDAYTTWCGPCIQMAKNIFPKEEVGQAFNPHFINVKVQLDTTKNDNEEVKSWYADGHEIMTKYEVRAFPTYLFFDPNGKLVHRAVGSSPADVFISKGKDAMNPDKQYYVLLDQYKAGKKDPDFLRKMAMSAHEAYDGKNKSKISKEYLATQTDLTTKENLEFLTRFTESSKDPGFSVIVNNQKKYDELKGEGAAGKMIVEILMREEVFPKIFTRDATTPNWNDIEASINKSYPAFTNEVVSNAKVIYYQNKKDWSNFQTAVVDYMKNYGSKSSPYQLNNFAWAVFEHCKDMTCVKEALEWSRRSFKDKEDPMYIDTYANILYKLGNKEEAIKWEEKAIALGGNFHDTLEKMKKGEKTWKE